MKEYDYTLVPTRQVEMQVHRKAEIVCYESGERTPIEAVIQAARLRRERWNHYGAMFLLGLLGLTAFPILVKLYQAVLIPAPTPQPQVTMLVAGTVNPNCQAFCTTNK